MLQALLVFSGALAFAIGGTPVARRVARRTGMTDAPSSRKVHSVPMPMLGGAAIYLSVVLAIVLFGDRAVVAETAGILFAATLLSFLGLWDDRRPLRPPVKLLGQTLAAAVAVAAGVHTNLFGVPAVDVVVSLLWLLAVTNALNFMDNMDGLAGGVAAVASGFFLLMAVQSDQQLVSLLAAALLGACLGFLVYNFNPATIFMGDGGSLFLGFLLAALAIKLRFPGHPVAATWTVPVMVLAVPLFDLGLVIVSRIRRGVNPLTTGGKDHLSHRLVRSGATAREAALYVYLASCAAGALATFASVAEPREAWAALAVIAVAAAWGIWRLELSSGAARLRGDR